MKAPQIDVCADAASLLDRVKAMREGDVSIGLASGSEGDATSGIVIEGGARKFRVPTMLLEDFAPLDRAEAVPIKIQLGAIAWVLSTVKHAISPDESRAYMNGALLEIYADGMKAAATDGHRICFAEHGTIEGPATSILVSKTSAVLLAGMTGDAAATLRIDRNRITIDVGGEVEIDWTMKLVDAQFPPYEQVIPREARSSAMVGSGALSQAVQAVAIAAPDRAGGIAVRFAQDRIELSSQSADKGDGADVVDSEGVTGVAGTAIGINAKYLADALDAVGELAEIKAGDDMAPVIVKSAMPPNVTCMLMPVRLS